MTVLCSLGSQTFATLDSSSRLYPKPRLSLGLLDSVKASPSNNFTRLASRKSNLVTGSVTEEDKGVIPLKDDRSKEKENRLPVGLSNLSEGLPTPSSSQSSASSEGKLIGDGSGKLSGRTLNAIIVLGFGTFAVTKLLTIDHDYWHGWTLYEILRYAPEHNWMAYEQALKSNPVLAKMAISGIVYSIGDWIAQCYEGKPIFEFDLRRLARSGLVGFTLHGSLSHYYYQLCEALFPFEGWWVIPAKVAFDQTVWSAVWNSIYFVCLGFLRQESLSNIISELNSTFWPMLTAGWKLWPFAHLVTYGLIPLEQRLLWVDCVELIWVTILSTYSNEKSETQLSEASSDSKSSSSTDSKLFFVAGNILPGLISLRMVTTRRNNRSQLQTYFSCLELLGLNTRRSLDGVAHKVSKSLFHKIIKW